LTTVKNFLLLQQFLLISNSRDSKEVKPMSDFDFADDDEDVVDEDAGKEETVRAPDAASARKHQLETRRRIEEALERRRFREEFGDFDLEI
jgi:hypothetical protein